jgi:hypothetical protein
LSPQRHPFDSGTPVGEDVTAYAAMASDPVHNPYIDVSTNYGGDGTSGQWDQPSTSWTGNFIGDLVRPGAYQQYGPVNQPAWVANTAYYAGLGGR